MNQSIFDYKDYKVYLAHVFAVKGRGQQSRLAQAIHCQTAYVSQVLNGNAHFSLEQAENINHFLDHTKEESHFFLLLIQLARAGTETLKQYFLEHVNDTVKKHLILKNRLTTIETVPREKQVFYYSSWIYATIHVMLSIPEFQTKEAISKYLGLPLSKVSEVLNFLTSIGLAKKENNHFKIGKKRIHVGHDSPIIFHHHTNWRMAALRSLDRPENNHSYDLHYSSVVTLSKEDILKIKSHLIKEITEVKNIIKNSEEEVLF